MMSLGASRTAADCKEVAGIRASSYAMLDRAGVNAANELTMLLSHSIY